MSETSTFEEIIEKDGYLVYTCKGFSMMPLLRQHRDLVVISKITEPLKKYDVILFKRNGKYILHRILTVKDGAYDTAGAAYVEARSRFPRGEFIIQQVVNPAKLVAYLSPVV